MRQRQTGVLVFITPIILLLIVMFGVLMLDGARLYSMRQAMQSEVNAAATAAADSVQTCGGLLGSVATMHDRAVTAAKAQGFDGNPDDLAVQSGLLEGDKDNNLQFRAAPYDQSNAVLVSYHRNVPISMLLPKTFLGGVDLHVNAAVRKEAIATISAAGSTATVNGGLLGPLLGAVLGQGDAYSLDPTSLESLQNTTIRLGQLLKQLKLNKVADLLPLSGADLASALRDIASSEGATGVAGLLDNLFNTLSQGNNTIQISDVLDVVDSAVVPSESQFPLYDVVISLVLNAAKSQSGPGGFLSVPLNISNLDLGPIASIQNIGLKLYVGEPPTVAIGPARKGSDERWKTRFYAPDISMQLDVKAKLLGLDLGLIKLTLGELDIPLAVSVGGGHGALVGVDCARGASNDAQLQLEVHREVVHLVTGTIDSVTGQANLQGLDVKLGSLKILPDCNIPIVCNITNALKIDPAIRLQAELDALPPPSVDRIIDIVPHYPLYCSAEAGCATKNGGDPGESEELDGLDLSLKITHLYVLGADLENLVQPITDGLQPILNGIISSVAQGVINPLLEALGVGLSGLSVQVSNVDQSNIQLLENVPLADGN